MKNPSDKILWRQFRSGSEEALSSIYEQYVDLLFLYGKKFTSDEALILDVIQDLFLYLLKNRNTIGDTDSIKFYLLKAYRRRLFKELNRVVHFNELNENSELESTTVFSRIEEMILDEEKSEVSMKLKQALSKLSTQQQEILFYRFSYGLDYKQISEIMSISNDSSRQIVSRSVKTLKKYLNTDSGLIYIFFLLLS